MDKDNRERTKIISELKKVHGLDPVVGLPDLNLSSFKAIKRGRFYKVLFAWRLLDWSHNTFLVSLRNSVEQQHFNEYMFMQTDHQSGRYFALLIELSRPFLKMIIRPFSIGEKITNMFLDFDIKLDDRKEFNSKYIVESNGSKVECEDFLTLELTNLIQKQNNFYLEITDSGILVTHRHEIEMHSSRELLLIGQTIDKILSSRS